MGKTLMLLLLVLPAAARAEAANPSFYLVNNAAQPITEIYASPAAATGWGRDRLGAGRVAPGGYTAVRLLADGTCTFDLRVVYADGRTEQRRGVNTCALDNIGFGQAAPGARPAQPDPSFRIVNRGRSGVSEVYATPAGNRNWGDDWLDRATIAPRSVRIIRLPMGQCIYDVRIVFDDGGTTERRRIDLCSVTDLPVP